MNAKRGLLGTACLVFVFLTSGVPVHAEADSKAGDLNNYLCKDLMRFSGTTRDIAIGVLHGFYLGKKNTTTYDIESLSQKTDEIIEYCLDNPNAKALAAFSRFVE